MDDAVPGSTPTIRPEQLTPEMVLRLRGLTSRQAEAALQIGRGFRVRVIAERLQVSPSTAKSLLSQARAKLGCRDA